jgi:hypothetical protein
MSLTFEDATVRPRVALASMVTVTLAILAPSLTATATDASTTVTLALLMLAIASLVRIGRRVGAVASRGVAATAPTGDGPPPPVAGPVTDPMHHPLRPRAPGIGLTLA